jgi:hypothetical protein
LIDDLITNNKPYRKVVQERLAEAGVPSTFTVYRGRPGESPRGYGKWKNDLVASVSTNRLFAQEFSPTLEEPVIDSYTIVYDDILALGAINEGELIIRLPKSPDSTTDANSEEEQSLFVDAAVDARRNARKRRRARIEPEADQWMQSQLDEAISDELPPGLFSAAESRPIEFLRKPLPQSLKELKDQERALFQSDSDRRVGVIPEIENLRPLLSTIKDPENAEGFTVRIDGRPIPKGAKRYALAPIKSAEHIVSVKDIRLQDVVKFADDIRRVADVTGRDVYAGGWKKGDNYYLDAVSIFKTLPEALYTAEDGYQEAIFDLGEFYEIDTKEGIEGLKRDGSFNSEARNVVRRNNEKDRYEYEKARHRDLERPPREYETNLDRLIPMKYRPD